MKSLNVNWAIFLSLFLISIGCQPSTESADVKNEEQDTVPSDIQLVVKQDAINMDKDQVYTYKLLEAPNEPLANIPSVEKPAVSPAEVVEKTIQPMPKGKKGDFRPPLFIRDCLTTEEPEKCSHKFLSSYVDEYIEKKKTTANDPSPLMYVSFILTVDGKVQKGSIRVEPKNYDCKDCMELANEIVQDMPGWVPAMKNGESVKATIRFPIHFES